LKVASFKEYLNETYTEMVHRVTWPTWKELQNSAILVVVASLLFAILIALMDFVFGANPDSWWKGVLGTFYSLF
jgi:preprotein translocase subunit SecE